MAEAGGRGGRWRFAWLAGATSFVVLSLVAVVVGWVLTMVDPQYEASSVVERALVGIVGGVLAALVASPVTASISLAVAGGARRYERRSTSGAGSPSTTE